MNQLILDTSDPDIQDMVSQWKDGGKYRVELQITQESNVNGKFVASVDEVMDSSEVSPEEDTQEESGESEAPGEEEMMNKGSSMRGAEKGMEGEMPMQGKKMPRALMIAVMHGAAKGK